MYEERIEMLYVAMRCGPSSFSHSLCTHQLATKRWPQCLLAPAETERRVPEKFILGTQNAPSHNTHTFQNGRKMNLIDDLFLFWQSQNIRMRFYLLEKHG